MTETEKRTRARRGTAPILLLDAARELFAEQGYHAATTRQIAERAGVSEDLIFRYYGTKSGLLTEAVLRPLMESVDDLALQWADVETLHNRSDEELISWFTVSLFRLIESNRTIGRAMAQILTEGPNDPEFEELRDKFSGLFEPLVASIDEQLTARGLRRTDPALQLRMMMIQIASVALFLPSTYRDVEVPGRDAVVKELTIAALNGLREHS